MIPVWLLDVDGVINAAGLGKPPTFAWPADQWTDRHVITMGGHKLRIRTARPVLDFICEVHEQGRAEIRWHTTWQEDAQTLAVQLGLPEFPVQDAPEYKAFMGKGVKGWWKRPAAERILDEGRALVWTDDDITWSLGRRGEDELRTRGPVLLVSPSEQTGLLPKHLRQIGDFLDLYPADVPSEEGAAA